MVMFVNGAEAKLPLQRWLLTEAGRKPPRWRTNLMARLACSGAVGPEAS
jgi:hypothetical protein